MKVVAIQGVKNNVVNSVKNTAMTAPIVPTKEEAKAGTENNGTFVQNADNEKTDATKSTDAGSTADGKVDINTAGKDELMTLSGIGEAKADAIIRYRDEHGKFQKIEDLMEVEGIKDGVFQKVKDQIKI